MKNNHAKKIKEEEREKQNLDSICTWDATDGAISYVEKSRFDGIFSRIVLRSKNWGMLE